MEHFYNFLQHRMCTTFLYFLNAFVARLLVLWRHMDNGQMEKTLYFWYIYLIFHYKVKDGRLQGGYENVPTRDIHMNQVSTVNQVNIEKCWLRLVLRSNFCKFWINTSHQSKKRCLLVFTKGYVFAFIFKDLIIQ